MVLAWVGLPCSAAVLSVGPGKTYPRPCAAITAAAPGDTIEIYAAGDYSGDVCAWTKDGLILRGAGGRPRIDAAGRSSQSKAIWVISGNDTVVENIEFSGAAVADKNGAGIRQEGRNLTIRNCYFHDNEEGILAGDSPGSRILIEYSEFANNGAGDGFSHNLYINHVAQFTLRFCYSHHSKVGHLVKTRAAENYILYNRLSDEAEGTGSYEINIPNGGRTFVIGNLVQQGPRTQNSTVMTYRDEGPHAANPDTSLYIVNNTFVNDRPGDGTFISISAGDPTPAIIRNNFFIGTGRITTQSNAVLEGNLSTQERWFANAAAYDYRLRSGSPAIDAGVEPEKANSDAGYPLTPTHHYVHPACGEARTNRGKIDSGAYEYAGSAYFRDSPARCRMISPNGAVNGANFLSGPIAPGSLVSVFGANLAAQAATADSFPLPQVLAGTSVSINGMAAPLYTVGPDQVNLQAPFELQPGPGTVIVTVEGVDTAAVDLTIAAAAPAIFGLTNASFIAGSIQSVYFTGQGQVIPPLETGVAPDSARPPVLPVRATIAGRDVEVVAAGLLTGIPGIAQARIRIPTLPAGVYPLVITVGDSSSGPVDLNLREAMIASMIFALAVASPLALAERVTCAVKADTWVDAPPFGRTAESPAANNHGAAPQLVINGRNAFCAVAFRSLGGQWNEDRDSELRDRFR